MKNYLYVACISLLVVCLLSSCKEEEQTQEVNITKIVKKMFDYFGKGDIASFLANCTDDCIFDVTGNQILNP